MNALIVDGGARAHALAWKLAQSPECGDIYIAPGRAGIANVVRTAMTPGHRPIEATDIAACLRFAKDHDTGLLLPTADDPLGLGIVDGFYDIFQDKDHLAFGPTKAAAEIEGSKAYMKQLAEQAGVPTAEYKVFETQNDKDIIQYVGSQPFPVVVKASERAEGKGVRVCENLDKVKEFLGELRMAGHFGKPGQEIVVEEYLEGPEISLHAWCDGETYRMFPFAMQDHKNITEDINSPMTGGMGVIAPLPGITPEDIELLGKIFVEPFIKALKAAGHPFKGILYPGLKLTAQGPKLLEINARPGDPEIQACMPLLETDLVPIMRACAEGKLSQLPEIKWRQVAAICIVLAAEGYPKATKKGAIITGLELLEDRDDVLVFQGGTKMNDEEEVIVNGGRALSVVTIGREDEPLGRVMKRGYEEILPIRFGGKRPQIRTGIGKTALSPLFRERVAIMRQVLAA
ncbi:MAG TPA: phosphoribosylamine--glycine ligase [Candidatus Saccharimonadales bacterium]|nr:phosphoribosylamine--glycine ligase [Candidatus Saccharimonadales bacterium]